MITLVPTCNAQINPLAISTRNPRLSWMIQGESKYQIAYRILVATSKELLIADKYDLWDSTKIESNQSQNIVYGGIELHSRSCVFWKVKIWDQNNVESDWSEINFWIMGILSESEWHATWIGASKEIASDQRFLKQTWLQKIKTSRRGNHQRYERNLTVGNPQAAIYLRRKFMLNQQPNIYQAICRVVGLGYYEFFLNGKKIGNHVLDPSFTAYDHRILYQTYDVSSEIVGGINILGAILGGGFYYLGTPDLFGFEKAPWSTPPKFLCELEIMYEDGTVEFVHSDEQWKYSKNGPIQFNCVRSGEVYDSRLEFNDWLSPNFNVVQWASVRCVSSPYGMLLPQEQPAIERVREIVPIKHISFEKFKSKVFVYHFPENIAGWVQITLKNTRSGQKITLFMNERLKSNGRVNMQKLTSHTYGQFQTDQYICSGASVENWEPRFTYHGFQYVEVHGINNPADIEIKAIKVHTAFTKIGQFECSDPLLNQIQEMAERTFLNNFHSIPEDCPQREKMGWLEDGLVAANMGIYNYDAYLAYRKWIYDIVDAQDENGNVPSIVPTCGWGRSSTDSNKPGVMADPWWAGAIILLPWRIYVHYGDKLLLDDLYPNMCKYIDFLTINSEKYIISWSLGDWLEVGSHGTANRTPVAQISTLGFYHAVQILAKIAQVLKKMEDQAKFLNLAQNIRDAYIQTYLDSDKAIISRDTQSASALEIYTEILPDSLISKVTTQLVANITDSHHTHLSTGIVGTYFLLQALAKINNCELAYKIITAKGYPGWQHMIANGSTTIWEDWRGKESLNHPVQGSVSAWFFQWILGIQADVKFPGFERCIISPNFIPNLNWATGSTITPFGTLISSWKRIDSDHILHEVIIPPNSTALVKYSYIKSDSLTINKQPFIDLINLQIIAQSKNKIEFQLSAGKYVLYFTCVG